MALINNLIGNFGRYQLYLCLIVFTSKFGVAFHQMAILYLAPPVSYTCPNNKTCCDNPVYDKSVFKRTIVMEWNLICEKAWLKDFTQTLFQFGVLSGSLLFGIASDRFGRRPTLLLAVLLEVFLGVISSFLPDYWSFTIARMFLGLSVGGIMVIGFVLIVEYVGGAYKDAISALFHIPFTLGHILLALFGFLIRDYVHFQLGISLANIVLIIYICLLPESPRWLMATGKVLRAIKQMEHVAKINNLPTEDIECQMQLYLIECLRSGQRKGTVLDLFRNPSLRRNILIMCFLWFVCSYSFYGMAHYISHMTGNVHLNIVACGTVCLCACLIAIPLIKVSKRKILVCIPNVMSSICFLFIIVIPDGIGSVIMGCLGIWCSFLVFIVIYLYCSEMFPTVVRSSALGIASMMARLGAMVAPFAAALRPFGSWCSPLAFGILPLVAALLCLVLPETKDCDLMMTIQDGQAQRRNTETSTEEIR
ncbi:unnamed protein product [Pieris macdunnoughi]|uniref:Major facilitator superfamily (MFS) profile domain-containing protein n=1 Tax=Pieris macdunnoughi TaxID=345717 RepID=A0A821SA54_9NEOP|nr:unnamed protein product [Pieris macdunnoughi]